MSSKPNRTARPPDNTHRAGNIIDLSTARRMLPLVRRIVADIVKDRQDLERFSFEQEGLDRDKRNLSWPERQRRYFLHREVAQLESRLREEQEELVLLGAVLVNPATGSVGFPTEVNGQPAWFSWEPGEENVLFWHFDGDSNRQPIPPNWADSNSSRLSGSRR